MEPTGSPDLVLSLEDLLVLTLQWEKEPLALGAVLPRKNAVNEVLENIPVARQRAIDRVEELPGFAGRPVSDFDHAWGWQEARIAVLTILEAQLESRQPDQAQLAAWSEELDKIKGDKGQTITRRRTWQTEFDKKRVDPAMTKGGLADAEVLAAAAADEMNKAALLSQEAAGENLPVTAEPLTRVTPEVSRAEAPVSPVAPPRYQPTGAENWQTVWAGWAKDPFGKLRALFTSGRKPAAAGAEIAARVGAVAKVGAGAGGAAAKAGLLVAPSGIGQVIGVALLAKDAVKKLFSREFWERVKNGAVYAGLQLYLWFTGLMANIVAGGVGLTGAVAGMIVGAKAGMAIGLMAGPIGGLFGGVIGGALGAAAGWFVGYGLGNIASGILGIGGIPSMTTATAAGMGVSSTAIGAAPAAVPAAAGATTLSVGGFTISGASSSLAALLSGTSVASIAIISVAGSLLALVFSVTVTLAAVLQEEPPPEPPTQEALFTLTSQTNPTTLANDSDSSVTYSVTVSAGSEKDIEVTIKTLVVLQKNGNRANLADPQAERAESFTLAKGQSQTLSYRPYPIPESYNDTRLFFTATVTANAGSESGQDIQTTSALTKIGSPPEDTNQPFGFPASGRIVRFEDDPEHRGTFFNQNGGRYWVDGGLDIVGLGGTPVYSTVNGQVIYSGFDLGDEKHNCTNAVEPIPPMKRCAVGGAVIIRSGDYIISFLHLRQNGLASGQVAKGQIIGYFYDDALPTSTQPHVHYQVLLNGVNVPFGTVANASDAPCSSLKILPEPVARQMIVTQDGSGPFSCQ